MLKKDIINFIANNMEKYPYIDNPVDLSEACINKIYEHFQMTGKIKSVLNSRNKWLLEKIYSLMISEY